MVCSICSGMNHNKRNQRLCNLKNFLFSQNRRRQESHKIRQDNERNDRQRKREQRRLSTTFDINAHLDALPSDIGVIDVSNMNLHYLPDLSRFHMLTSLYLNNNKLRHLPNLPNSLKRLLCGNNNLYKLPKLNKNLEILQFQHNMIKSIPVLPPNLRVLYCFNNQLIKLPNIHNNLRLIKFDQNPICEIIVNPNTEDNFINVREVQSQVRVHNNFIYNFYCHRYKIKFRDFLFQKVREPRMQNAYHPIHLIQLNDDDDLDGFLINWTN